MTPLLDVRGLTRSYGARTLFRGVDLSVVRGEKVGVIGPNGSGKSTLFRILAGLEAPDEGTLALSRGATVGYLPQEPEMDPERTVFETAAEARHDLPHPVPDWDWTHRVEAILTRLGNDAWDRPTGRLSGGERRRVALARALLSEPDLLLLDEPTNHLDADTVLWLEETLFDFPGAVLVVTHDRYFLDRVVDRMIEVAPDGFRSYEGGYTDYLEARTAREAQARTEEAKRVKLLEKELAWARRSPPARTGKQKARRERAREMARAQEARDRSRPGQVELEVTDAPRLGRTVLEFHEVSKAFGDHTLMERFSDRLAAGERIGVVGPNGSGKTTLLRIAVGEEEPDEGRVVWGENTRIGYFDQERELDPELTVARAVAEADWVEVGGRRMHLAGYLERFLFPPHVQRQKVSALSGGERSRVLLARLFLEEFNLLVMDEPTNDLDLDTLRILEDAIEDFQGCVLLVTHDRFLLDKVATSLLVFEGDGRLRRHHGSWDRYLARREEEEAAREARQRAEEKRRREERAAAAREQAREARSGKKRLSFHEQRELDRMEGRIAELEEEKDALAERLADPAFYAAEGKGDGDEVTRVTRRFREVEGELEALYERWMELEEMAG